MKMKSIILLTMFLLVLGTVLAEDWNIIQPADGLTFLSTDADGNNIIFTVNLTPTGSRNVTEISLLTNNTGSWIVNETFTNSGSTADIAIERSFEMNFSLSDGEVLTFSFNGTEENSSGGIFNLEAGVNRTLTMQYTPTVIVNVPADAGSFSTTAVDFDITYVGNYTDDLNGQCRLYSNSSGSWAIEKDQIIANDTRTNITFDFVQDDTYLYNFQCFEQSSSLIYGWVSSNRTVVVAAGLPTITLNTANETWSTARAVQLSYTATDDQLGSCDLYIDDSLNQSNATPTSGGTDLFDLTFAADGNYSYYVTCNNTANFYSNSSTNEIRVDSLTPGIGAVSNVSRQGFCDQWAVTINPTETVNLSGHWGPTTDLGSTASVTTFSGAASTVNLDSQGSNIFYNMNITACDPAGNCNVSESFTYTFPFAICNTANGGWSGFGIYETAGTNMSDILNQTSAEFVYWWNHTGQAWKFAVPGTTSNHDLVIQYGDVVQIYESTNSTWDRDDSGTGYYSRNISAGHNYFAVTDQHDSNFGDFAMSFLNASDAFGVENTLVNGTALNFTFFTGFNRSQNAWDLTYIYNWTSNNETNINKTGQVEVVHVWSTVNTSDWNIYWNGSDLII